jgi:hypothetical protein
MRGRQVFLSHASEDRRLATRLASMLERHRVSVWYSATALRGSEEWQSEIGRALASCRWFLLIATPAACRKPKGRPWWVQREVLYALNSSRYEGRVVPLQMGDAQVAKLSWYLPQIQYIDFRPDYHEGCAVLLRTWNKRYRR